MNTQGSGGCWTHKNRGGGGGGTRKDGVCVLDTQGSGVVGQKDRGVLDTRIREGGWVLDTQGSGVGGCWTHKDRVVAVLDTQGSGGWGVLDTQGLGVCVLDTQGFAEPGGTGLVQ